MANNELQAEIDTPEYIDKFKECLPELEQTMIRLETDPEPQLLLQAFDLLSDLRRNLAASTDMAVISVAEGVSDLVYMLNFMAQSEHYVTAFSDLVLLVMDRLALLLRDAEKGLPLDFASAQALLLALQPLKDKTTSDTVEREINNALQRMVNLGNATGETASAEGDIELFGEDDFAAEPEISPYTLFMSSVDYIARAEPLELETMFRGATTEYHHSTFILPMALTLNKMLGNMVSDQALHQAILFHDIGTRVLPESIFSNRKLTPLEYQLITTHPSVAVAMLRPFVSTEVLQIIEQHHERIDGTGYPNRLRGDEIVLGARILALCDAFDAMTQPRAHKPIQRSYLRALAEINACMGEQFDYAVVLAFNKLIQCPEVRAYAPGAQGRQPL